MPTQSLLERLTELRLPAFRNGLAEQLRSPQYASLSFEERLALLIDLECTHRQQHRIQRRLKAANFPFSATLEELDLSPDRGLDRRFLLELARCEWLNTHLNLLVFGPTGAGKTFVSCALGTAACRRNHLVRYVRTSRLLHQLARAHLDGSYPELLANLARLELLILDDWMRDPLTAPQAQDLFEILDDRFGQSSTLVASQVPVADWYVRFPDPTLGESILDRLVHNTYRINLVGESQRKIRSAVQMPVPMPSS